jgi:hypothetical protein
LKELTVEIQKYPAEPDAKDRIRDLAQDLGIPGVGFLVKQAIPASLELRQQKWFDGIRDVLTRHEELLRQLAEENAPRTDEILSLIAEGYTFSSRTHLEDKLNMFLLSIENSILEEKEYEIASVFLRLVSELQPIHFKLLSVYADPRKFFPDEAVIIPLEGHTDILMRQLIKAETERMAEYVPIAEKNLESHALLNLTEMTKISDRNITI